ncbi:MAG: histone deacetylase family protein [Halioglobus sp.]|nr:histone deacetylase family protein [Halioglobus sp.]
MFRIRQIHDASTHQNRLAVSAVLKIYQEAFDYYPEYAAKISEMMKFPQEKDFEVVLLVAEGHKERILGFALSFYYRRLRYGYLDYIASNPNRHTRGYGSALYEATCEWFWHRKANGLFLDVPTDDPELLLEKDKLAGNRRRLAFYERFGARPVANTAYESTAHKANAGAFTYLVFDDLETGKPLSRKQLRAFLRRMLAVKGNMDADDAKLKVVLDSIKDDPVQLRPPRYLKKVPEDDKAQQTPLEFVTTGDALQIHHLKEKGYVERPARVHAILKGLDSIPMKALKPRHFAERHIQAVHHPELVKFLKRGEQNLGPGQLLYPNVFPVRHPDRIPQSWDNQAGYYCIDNFTPVTSNCYLAARNAVDAALTAAQRVAKGSRLCYALCRPPGHHAESRVFGGFCYFNNASIAAHYLSQSGRVALLDIDHHHGNGSQEIFYRRNDVYVVSIHGHPRLCYPYFSGYAEERGEGKGKGFNRNFPLYPGVDDHNYADTLEKALGVIKAFRPDYLVLSLGFDIMKGDPTGTFDVTPRGMYRIGRMLADTGLPILVVQEGGYSLRNLRSGALEFFRGLTHPT